jgi:L-gulonate 3-dehydrogenase
VPKVVLLGAGSIGVSFAATFSDRGHSVTLAEPDRARRDAASAGIESQREAIGRAGLLRDGGGAISIVEAPGNGLADADIVIECGPEKLETKQAIFADLIERAGRETVLTTASSAIPMSRIVTDAAAQRRCLVAHPVNPPSVLRLIELAPAPGTDAAIVAKARSCFEQAGFEVVALSREIDGFVLNRLQSAVLREAYRLVDEGIVDVAGVEAVMRLGLGPRWALSGPFETAELNTPGGIRAHAARMGPAYRAIGEQRGEMNAGWSDELVAEVDRQRRQAISLEALPARAAWRVGAVAALVALRDRLYGNADDK